jgi:hypothetical protein
VPLVAGADPFDIYGNLTGKTVLTPSGLPRLPVAVITDLPSDKTNAIARIEKALSEQGLEVVQDGPHFVRVFRKEARDSFTNAPLRGAQLAGVKGQEAVAPGAIEFVQADLDQVLSIYAVLSQRTVLLPITLPVPTFSLKTQCALTKEEVLYAFTTVLALNGICVVQDGANLVQVVPMAQRAQVKARAPNREQGAKLFDPKKLPSLGGSAPPRPLTETDRIEREFERLCKTFYELMHLPDPSKHPARRLLGLYADLAGKTATSSKNLDATSIWFHVETPLTKSELLYAIETTFALHNLAIVPVDNRRIRVGHISELLRNNGGRLERVQPR